MIEPILERAGEGLAKVLCLGEREEDLAEETSF